MLQGRCRRLVRRRPKKCVGARSPLLDKEGAGEVLGQRWDSPQSPLAKGGRETASPFREQLRRGLKKGTGTSGNAFSELRTLVGSEPVPFFNGASGEGRPTWLREVFGLRWDPP